MIFFINNHRRSLLSLGLMALILIIPQSKTDQIGDFFANLGQKGKKVGDDFKKISENVVHNVVHETKDVGQKIDQFIVQNNPITQIRNALAPIAQKLAKAADDLSNAPKELYKGIDEIALIPNQLDQGIVQINDGIDQIRTGLKEISTQDSTIAELQKNGLPDIASTLQQALNSLKEALAELANTTNCKTAPTGVLCDLQSTMENQKQLLLTNVETMKKETDNIQKTIEETQVIQHLKNIAHYTGN